MPHQRGVPPVSDPDVVYAAGTTPAVCRGSAWRGYV
jgi:hypothetical protein